MARGGGSSQAARAGGVSSALVGAERRRHRAGETRGVAVEADLDEDLQEALAEELAAAGDERDPAEFGVTVNVTLEPAGAPQDGVDLMMAVLELLAKTCDGVVLAN